MSKLFEETVWIIMAKNRTMVAKGTPRNRCMVNVDADDKKRFLTYTTKGKATAGFTTYGFYNAYGIEDDEFEAVEVTMTMSTKD